MSIKTISDEELRRMNKSEGIILQGCGGNLNEWVDGINEMLTEDGILKENTKFNADNVRTFEHDNLTCLLFPFDDSVKVNIGKLAMWRLKTHNQFGGTWLSDFIPNYLGGFVFDDEPLNVIDEYANNAEDTFDEENEQFEDSDESDELEL